jgi:hypothetical protein
MPGRFVPGPIQAYRNHGMKSAPGPDVPWGDRRRPIAVVATVRSPAKPWARNVADHGESADALNPELWYCASSIASASRVEEAYRMKPGTGLIRVPEPRGPGAGSEGNAVAYHLGQPSR